MCYSSFSSFREFCLLLSLFPIARTILEGSLPFFLLYLLIDHLLVLHLQAAICSYFGSAVSSSLCLQIKLAIKSSAGILEEFCFESRARFACIRLVLLGVNAR